MALYRLVCHDEVLRRQLVVVPRSVAHLRSVPVLFPPQKQTEGGPVQRVMWHPQCDDTRYAQCLGRRRPGQNPKDLMGSIHLLELFPRMRSWEKTNFFSMSTVVFNV